MKGWIQGFALRPRPKKCEDLPIVLTWKSASCFFLFQKNGCLRISFAEGLFRGIKKSVIPITDCSFSSISGKKKRRFSDSAYPIRNDTTASKVCVTFLSCYISFHQDVTLLRGRPFNSWVGGWMISGQQAFFFLATWWAGYFFPF